MVNQAAVSEQRIFLACTAALLATIMLVAVRFFYVPLSVDGGWFSYPALSLSRNGDPGENQLDVDSLKNYPGVRASFGFDTRQSIRVIPMSWWFKAFQTNIWTAKLYGILEMFLLMIIALILLLRVCRERSIAFLCWAIYITDSVMITQGSSDLRPDIMVAVLTSIVFISVVSWENTFHMLKFFLGLFGMFLLPLVAVTAAIPLALLSSFLVIELLVHWKQFSMSKRMFYMCLVVLGITSFLLRGIVLDIVIPTQHVMSKAVNVKKEIYDSLTAGGLLIFKKELSRWGEYLLKSNIGLFLAVLLGLFFLVSSAFKPRKANLRWGNMSIALGCVAALGTLTFVDPHPWASHGLAIVPFFMVILARELESVKDLKARSVGISFLLVLVIFCAAVKVGQGANQIRKGIQYKYSNPAVITTLNNVLVEKKNYVIIGPTEVWPYINPKANVVINDNARAKGMEALRGIINEFDFIVLDSDYEGYNWEARFKERYPLIRLEQIAEVGSLENGSYHLKILKPMRQ